MKRKLLSIIMTLSILMTLLPTMALATESGPNIAKNGNNYYSTLAEAMDKANLGDTVTLVANTSEDIQIPDGKEITIDLGKYNLTGAEGGNPTIINNGILTLTGTGTISTDANYDVQNFGTLTINGSLKFETGTDAASLIENGFDTVATKECTMVINGGTFKGGLNVIKNDIGGNLTINGGTFCKTFNQSGTAVVLNYGAATVKGGIFETASSVKQDLILVLPYEGADPSISVTGGTFKTPTNKYAINNATKDTSITMSVSGGIYSTSLIVNPVDGLKDGYVRLKETEGTYTVTNQVEGLPKSDSGFYYENESVAEASNYARMDGLYYASVSNAIKAVPTDGAEKTITVLKDSGMTGTGITLSIEANQKIVVDFNGHNLRATKAADVVTNNGALTVKNAVITSAAATAKGKAAINNSGELTLSNVDLVSNSKALVNSGNMNEITDGKYTGEIVSATQKAFISGGYFTANPTEYITENHVVVDSDISGFNYSVVDKAEHAADIVSAAPEVKMPTTAMTEGEKEIANNFEKALTSGSVVAPSISDEIVNVAAESVANTNTITAETRTTITVDGKQRVDTTPVDALKDVTGENVDNDSVTIVVQPYMDIAIKDVDISDGNTTLVLDIKPMYKTVATTANLAKDDEIVLNSGNPDSDPKVNAVEIGSAKELEINKTVTIIIPLTNDFVGINAYIKHTLSNGRGVRYYTGSVNEDKILTFENPDGFSEFAISTVNGAAAEVNGIGYDTLQDAVDAVNDGQTVKILKADQTAMVSRTVTFKVDGSGESGEGITAGNNTTLNVTGDTYEFVYTAPQGSGTQANYTLAFETNGGSAVEKISKAAGTTVDLAAYTTTREGYTFDGWYKDAGFTEKLTSVKLTENTTVYAKWTESQKPSKFVDVADDAYYADAVAWAVDKGITSGTTATTFNPDEDCTRAQAVTFIWRAAGSPDVNVNGVPFKDVESGSYYEKAVAWAVAQGITSGTSATAFSPNVVCTRGQIVTMLARWSGETAGTQNPFVDVPAGAYYENGVLWAVSKGVTSGTSATTFSPDQHCTRAQIVTFLYRYMGE